MQAERKIIHEIGVKPAISQKKKYRRFWGVMLVALMALGVLVGFTMLTRQDQQVVSGYTTSTVRSGSLTLTTEASGSVVLPRQVSLVSPQKGYTQEIYVEEGQTITPSEVLAQLDVPSLNDKEAELEANLVSAQINLEELVIEQRYSRNQLKVALERRGEALAEAEDELATATELKSLRSSRESDYQAAKDAYDTALQDWEDASTSLKKQIELEDVALRKQQATIEQLELSLMQVRDDLEEMKIKSPIAGEILSINEDLFVAGSYIDTTDTLFQIADTGEQFIDLEIYEQYASQISMGELIDVTVGASSFKAEIIKIGRVASLSSDGLSATVSVRAKPVGQDGLTLGASAVAILALGTRENVSLLPRGSYLTTGGQKYLYVIDGDEAVRTEVTFGTIQGTQVEVLSGVDPGDEVITSGYQNFIDQETVLLK